MIVDDSTVARAVLSRMVESDPAFEITAVAGTAEDAIEALKCDLKLEQLAHPVLKEGIAHCESVGDYISRELLESILESEEEHIDFLETQLDLLQQVGTQNWLQSWNGAAS